MTIHDEQQTADALLGDEGFSNELLAADSRLKRSL